VASEQLPSVRVDDVRIDHGNASRGSITCDNNELYALDDGDTLLVSVDGGGAQTINFNAVDFDNIALATAQEVVDVIINGLVGGTAAVKESGPAVTVYTDTYGTGGSIQVTGGTANAAGKLNFATTLQAGQDASGLLLVNRIPEPDEDGHPVDGDIQLDIVSATGTAVALTEIDVYVDLALAYDGDGGGFQAGFTGPNSAVSLPDAATRRIVIDPTLSLDPSAEVTIRVVVGTPALDESYTFTTEDTVSPEITNILATGKKTIRVTFNEPMKAVSATASDDVLNPDNWTLTRNPPVNTPAVSVEVVSVAEVDSSTFALTTDIELTFGIEYLLTLENAVDLHDNVISATATDLPFDAFVPDFPAGRDFSLWTMLPEFNRAEDDTGDLARTIAVFQEVVNVLLSEMDEFPNILDPDFAPEPFLDAMLLDLGNPFDFVELEEIDKRRLIQTLVPIYQLKGTGKGIIDTIQFLLGITVTLNVFNTGTHWVLGSSSVTQARLVSSNAETFALADGQTLIVRLDDSDPNYTVTFNTADFVAIGAATAQEVADVITADVPGATAGAVPDGTVIIQRDDRGAGTAVQVMGGTANGALGFSTTAVRGEGTEHPDVSALGDTSILAPGTQRQLYTYEIISPIVLTSDQREKIEQIATYMHPAHCHLLRIVEPTTDVPIDHLELGASELGASATNPGTWILH
jgi:phage tail-like protein